VEAVSVPVPERLTVCGLPRALSVILTEALRLPLAEGVNVTLIVQEEPAATHLPHVLVSAKLVRLVPLTTMLDIINVALPVLRRLTVRALLVLPTVWLPKARLVGERLTAAEPLPKRITDCGLTVPLSVRVTAAARVPLAAGLKLTLVAQLVRAATLAPQSLVCAKSLA
jgi:hypothetical protein